MLKTIAFVPVRLTSSRLPGKHLKTIGDRPLLAWVLKRLRECREIDGVVICSPDEPETRGLADFAVGEGADLFVFVGDIDDVVGRLTAAAAAYQADICVLASGDCPLLSTPAMDKMVSTLKFGDNLDRVCIEPREKRNPIHEGMVVAKRWVWDLADKHSDRPELREHQFPVLDLHPEYFEEVNLGSLEDEDIYYRLQHRISVDTPADLEFMNVLYSRLAGKGKEFNLENVIELLADSPQLMKINDGVYQRGIFDKALKVLFFVTAAGRYGYGNLTRAMEIARVLVNRFGADLRFLVLDSEAVEILDSQGFNASLGQEKDLEEAAAVRDADIVVFDLQKDYEIEEVLVSGLCQRGIRVLFVDNIKAGAEKADRIIIPTAHYIGEDLPHMRQGRRYVVIRQEIRGQREHAREKNRDLLVYRVDPESHYMADPRKRPDPRKGGMGVERIESFTPDFPERLARAGAFLAPLGISAYEAFYLGTTCLLVPSEAGGEQEIQRFYDALQGTDPEELEQGADNIAQEIVDLVS